MGAQPGQGPVQLQQLQAVAAQPVAHQEGREARREEEQRAEVSLHFTQTFQLWWTEALPGVSRSAYSPSDWRSSSLRPEGVWRRGRGQPGSQPLWGSGPPAPAKHQGWMEMMMPSPPERRRRRRKVLQHL